MTVQELRNLLDATERVSGLPWSLDEDGDIRTGDGENLMDIDGFRGTPHETALIVAAVNALPALLDVAEAARLHDCQTTAGYSANLRARKEPPCPICDALERLGDT